MDRFREGLASPILQASHLEHSKGVRR
jgi:hypothetical protein